jgi:hypothetical protein
MPPSQSLTVFHGGHHMSSWLLLPAAAACCCFLWLLPVVTFCLFEPVQMIAKIMSATRAPVHAT